MNFLTGDDAPTPTEFEQHLAAKADRTVPGLEDIPPERLAAFVHSLRSARDVTLTLDQGTMARLRSHMNRLEATQPGTAYEADESDDDSIRIAVCALLDRGLSESEGDDGLVYSYGSGHVEKHARVKLRLRLKRTWRVLRRGW